MIWRALVCTATLARIASAETSIPPKISYAALGDSYASGDGAGSSKLLPSFDLTCGRFNEAYPVWVFNDSRLDILEADFKNLACGGQSSLTILADQVPWIGNSDVVTLTVGGNEVDFFVVLNACVHQWFPTLSSCRKEIDKAKSLIQSNKFVTNYNKMVVGALQRIKPGARLLLTGYATFFDAATTQCNHISFSRRDQKNFLTQELRQDLNSLVNMINDVIQASAEAHGPAASYVNIDRLLEGHRFCEEGVVEPSDGNSTWFFNMKPIHVKDVYQAVVPGPIKDFFDLTRTFHPTGMGHQAIGDEIVRMLLADLKD